MFGTIAVDDPLTTCHGTVDRPLPERGQPPPERGRARPDRGTATSQHLVVGTHTRTLHLVVLALTVTSGRRIVLGVASSTETPRQPPAGTMPAGQIGRAHV